MSGGHLSISKFSYLSVNRLLIPVFGPTLLKTTEGSASLSSLVDTVHQTRVVELLTRWIDIVASVLIINLIFRNATSVFGPPPIPGEGPGGRGGGRQRPSERHSGSETVPADIRIGNDGHCNKLMGCKICI